jgi:hypothetical protein
MRKFTLAISAAAMAASMPAIAHAQGKGKGTVKAQKVVKAKPTAKARARSDARIRSDRAVVGAGLNGCPPGLAKKSPPCLPPGQAKRLFEEGQRIPVGYHFFTDYSDIPELYRSRVPFDDDLRYIYRDDTVYVVDPRTRLVTDIIDLIL